MMEILKIFFLCCVLKLSTAQSASKCAEFKPNENGKFNEILMGQWNV